MNWQTEGYFYYVCSMFSMMTWNYLERVNLICVSINATANDWGRWGRGITYSVCVLLIGPSHFQYHITSSPCLYSLPLLPNYSVISFPLWMYFISVVFCALIMSIVCVFFSTLASGFYATCMCCACVSQIRANA